MKDFKLNLVNGSENVKLRCYFVCFKGSFLKDKRSTFEISITELLFPNDESILENNSHFFRLKTKACLIMKRIPSKS